MRSHFPRTALASVLLAVLAGAVASDAQGLEPNAYSTSPVGTMLVAAGFGRSTGAVVSDPMLPITDVEARINSAVVAGGYTFGLLAGPPRTLKASPPMCGRSGYTQATCLRSINSSLAINS